MKRIVTYLCLLVCLGFFTQNTYAQSGISAPYFLGFEESDAVELSEWVLNPGPLADQCPDKWVVGDAVRNEGRRSLYISSDGGANAAFGVAKNVQYAYRDFTIPAGQYEVSFDWACLGSPEAKLYAGVAAASAFSSMEAAFNSVSLDKAVLSGSNILYEAKGSNQWQNISARISSNGVRVCRLFFVWASANQDTAIVHPLGACIDNVQICSANCAKPKSVTATAVSCDSILVEWAGTSEKYSVQYRRRGRSWSVPTTYYQDYCYIENAEEGLYDFRVRGICNDVDTSAYTYKHAFTMFCPERHCINYVDLHDAENVTCYYGKFQNPQDSVGVIDKDVYANAKYWRHSVNWEPDEYDPRTCGQLPTIPEGELASVRLGNWNTGAEAECIEYTYVADVENSAILLLKYAVVLEDPNHTDKEQPHFTMEILNKDGDLISPTCGAADFYADANRLDGGWHACTRAPGARYNVSWKEWTTIGLNLAEQGVHTGDTLMIRLTTKDCSRNGHFGYAYFTLGCAAAKLYGTSCGSEPSLSVDAPEGFRYEWYNKYGEKVSDSKRLEVEPSDTTTYRCRLIYLENEECDFNLYSQIYPRFPISAFTYQYQPSNCENRVVFTNKSHVMTVFNNDTVYHYDERCEEHKWIFPNGETSGAMNPAYVFPKEGGTFPVTLRALISNGACDDDTTIYITVPKIGDTEQFVDTTICDGNYVQFGKYYAALPGSYSDSLVNFAGCDSIITLRLEVNPVDKTVLKDTTVCAEEPLCIDGECYKHTSSGDFVRFRRNQYGCDSTIWIHVNMQDSILPTIVVKEPENELGTGSVTLGGTGYDYFYLNGERYDASETYLTGFNGGIFDFEFFNDFGCSVLRSDTMGFECLGGVLGEVNFVCQGDAEWIVPLVLDSGILTTYSLLYDDEAHAAGCTDILLQPINNDNPVVRIPIPAGLQPNRYHAQLLLHNFLPRCGDWGLDVELPLHFSSDLLFQRWDDVLSVKGPDYNGGYTFTAYQWLKNGEPISGATKSYYYAEEKLDLTAEYQVNVQLPSGVWLTTCGFVLEVYEEQAPLPKKVIENQRVIIIRDGERYDVLGQKVQTK